MISECLVCCSMRLGVPFIAPRQLGVVGDQLGRQFLSSVGWRTRQSAVPPDMNSNCLVPDLLPFLAKPTVGSSDPLAHRTLSGVTIRPLARPRVARRSRRRPLAVGAVGSLHGPVYHMSHPDFRVQNPGANIITRCAGTKSHTYDESWHRIECHIFTT
jgi:hypothetical protein